jgi:ribosomal protein L11 methyltransferase
MTLVKPKHYLNITYNIPEEEYDLFYGVLSLHPFVGITEGLDTLVLCLLADDATDELLADIQRDLAESDVTATIIQRETVIEENWNKTWEDSIEPIIIPGIVAIIPSWRAADFHEPDNIPRLIIDPQMSFGTGHHETTRLCLQLLRTCVAKDSAWIDAGTGTGVLAFGALLFGASSVYAFDFDEWCVLNTKENIERNPHLSAQAITIEQANVLTIELEQADGICANLHRNLLYESSDMFYRTLAPRKGILIVSGLLWMDETEVRDHITASGFRHIKTVREHDWIAMQFAVSL